MISAVWDAKTARVVSTVLAFVAVLAFLHYARNTLSLFLFAVLFAYVVDPLVILLAGVLRGRMRGIVATYVLLGGVATGLGFLLGPHLVEEGKSLMTNLPALVDRLSSGQFIFAMGQNRGWNHNRSVEVQQFFLHHRPQIMAYAGGLIGRLEEPLTRAWWLILIPILSLFFLKDAQAMAFGLVRLGSDRKDKALLYGIVSDVNVVLGSYIRAQMILAALTGVVLTVVLGVMRVPYAFLFGPVAGVFEFIPVVGLAGGEIGGALGALISVPVLGILRILWLRLNLSKDMQTPVTTAAPEGLSTGEVARHF